MRNIALYSVYVYNMFVKCIFMEFLQKVTSCVIIAIYVDINNITYAAEWHDTPPILASQKGQLTPKKAACVHTMVSSNKATIHY